MRTEEVPDESEKVLELDELWSFVYRKSEKVWVWLALCRKTRQVVAFVMGDRNRATCRRLWQAIPRCYKEATCYSDFFWEAYQGVIPDEQHEAASARRKAKLLTLSAGSTLSGSGFLALLERRSPSPSRTRCTIVA